VSASNEDGYWSPEPASITFIISPPFWETWWARTGYGVFALLLILGIISWRTASLKKRQRELEHEVERKTKEIREQKEVVEKQKQKVEEQKKDITDSIQYAENIQQSLLPTEQSVQDLLPDSFILFQPKDIVSGDFYWMQHHNGKVYLAVCDCTGHGVPGAFMSMIGRKELQSLTKFSLRLERDLSTH